MEHLLRYANSLMRHSNRSMAFDVIFKHVNSLLRKRELERLNAELETINKPLVRELDIAIWIAVLTVTLPAKSELPARDRFFDMVEDNLFSLIDGLE